MLVSILILLEVILEVLYSALTLTEVAGFNPYFTGSNSGRHSELRKWWHLLRFNPYFTGSNSGRLNPCFNSIVIQLVSILILLEVILEELSRKITSQWRFSFNPYFTGSNSGSHLTALIASCWACFNPYFTGSNSGSSLFRSHPHRSSWFQSLFYWK